MSTESDDKTFRIGMLMVLVCFLSFGYFLFKIKACESKPEIPETCRDEFVEIRTDVRDPIKHKCSPGAIAEVVNSPPAPKPGVMCHCPPVK